MLQDNLFGHELEWHRKSGCRRMGTELFFAQEGESKHQRLVRERRAKELCSHCRVADLCRSYALDTAEPHGIWGGMSEVERRAALR